MKYKYHYVIINKNGEIIDTAQDLLVLNCILNWLCKYHGFNYCQTLTTNKKRISNEDWKARYY